MSDLRSVIDVRIRVCRFLMILSAAFLLLGLYFFQILHADKYVKLAWDNRLRLIRIPSSRGEIFDRNGSPLAVNITTFDILGYPHIELLKPTGVAGSNSRTYPFIDDFLVQILSQPARAASS